MAAATSESVQSPSGTVRVVALGCAKNQVDTERVAGNFLRAGWRLVPDGKADVVVVTTCGFVEESAQQSVDTLMDEIDLKNAGETQMLVAAGCLPDRYRTELVDAMPDLDLVVGVLEMTELPTMVEQWRKDRKRRWEFSSRALNDPVRGERLLSGPPWRAYLKVSDGCNQGCSFCVIPRIRGAHRSAPLDELVAEARSLVDQGVLELSLVAQDLTSYHTDIDGQNRLVELLERLDAIDGLEWIRLLYAHPAVMTDPIIDAMARLPRVLPYLDIPFQHVSDPMLKAMNRHMDKAGHERLLTTLRRRIPDIALRTTLIVGMPGETESDFEELLEFVEQWEFDNLGAFVYSREENTPAFKMAGQVDREAAEERLERLMLLQQKISRDKLARQVGKTMPVLIEEELYLEHHDRYTHIGRTPSQAPEIDGLTYVHIPEDVDVQLGDIVDVTIEDSTEYDLFGSVEE
ncbi:MAG: 30S ribosomal protein S12 methylthiotransferase RimO [Deltaproteobacteria bacterium]|nr:30S ribosomal protein S12 methylthiotransferase RimO [Deltaproteobacteria bacterium]